MDSLKEIYLRFASASKTFSRRRGTMLAAASTFYVILTIVPLVLLLVRMVGYFVGDMVGTQEQLFEIARNVFPDVAPQMLFRVKSLVSGPLFGGAKFTIINFLILLVSGLSFFNSIWSGLYLMTGDKYHVSLWKHLKGLVIIGVTIAILVITLAAGPTMTFLFNLMKSNPFIDYVYNSIETSRGLIDWFRAFDIDSGILFKSNWLYFSIFFIYFSFLYRWFFSWRIRMREAMLGAFTFVFFLILGKNLFWIYFTNVRTALIQSYGDYYTIIVGLVWVFMVMCFFFYGACLCHTLQKEPLNWGQLFQKRSENIEGEQS